MLRATDAFFLMLLLPTGDISSNAAVPTGAIPSNAAASDDVAAVNNVDAANDADMLVIDFADILILTLLTSRGKVTSGSELVISLKVVSQLYGEFMGVFDAPGASALSYVM